LLTARPVKSFVQLGLVASALLGACGSDVATEGSGGGGAAPGTGGHSADSSHATSASSGSVSTPSSATSTSSASASSGVGGAGGETSASSGGGSCEALPAEACSACCADTYDDGFSALYLVSYSCLCSDVGSCLGSCSDEFCAHPDEVPTRGCLLCMRKSFEAPGNCLDDEVFAANCAPGAGTPCADYVSCLLGCD